MTTSLASPTYQWERRPFAVPPGFASLLAPLWDSAKQVCVIPRTASCPDCHALDAVMLVLLDRGVPMRMVSDAGGVSRSAGIKRYQRLSLAHGLDLFEAGSTKVLSMPRKGMAGSDYSAWLPYVSVLPENGRSYQYAVVRRSSPNGGCPVLSDSRDPGSTVKLLPGMSLGSFPITRAVHPRHLYSWPGPRGAVRRTEGTEGTEVQPDEIVLVRADLLYIQGNLSAPRTIPQAVDSLPAQIQDVLAKAPTFRSLI